MENLEKILPSKVFAALLKLDLSRLYEIRMRKNVSVNYGGKFFGLTESGLSETGMSVTPAEIESVIVKASGHSIYAFNDQIKNGFLSLKSGVRIGICGEVSDKTIKNFTSLNIRFPHEIKGCADKVLKAVLRGDGCYNTLIVSPPGCGKTTMLRDLIRQLSNRGKNVLLADERYEIFGGGLDVGGNTDVISGGNKSFAFSRGIRYMRPDILAADELMSEDDISCVKAAGFSGVNVIATVHSSKAELKNKLSVGCFERIVVLTNPPGSLEGIYDARMNAI